MKTLRLSFSALAAALLTALPAEARGLKVHGVFSSHMVLQRDKPIKIWGWADEGETVNIAFGKESADGTAAAGTGRWEATFPAREANTNPTRILIEAGDETIEFNDILIGDVWVMNGQSNMAWPLGKTLEQDLEAAQANMPQLRLLKISTNEQKELQTDIPAEKLPTGGWVVSTPETAPDISAIGYNFGSRVQRATGVPIGIIDNSRGGASIESLVPERKLVEHPLTNRYYEHVKQREADFNIDELIVQQTEKWKKKVEQERKKGTPENRLPKKPTVEDVRSWSIPGMSPSDAGSCYNGMFGVFIGYNIKGVLFHQGYNNAMGASSRPKRYRAIMKLMVEGWREDFNNPELPVGIIGFCAGSIPQTRENFEIWSVSAGAFIRESQRLGLADVGDPENTAFLPAYDVQIPGLHPFKKQDHGIRSARWALNRVYDMEINWDTASLLSAEPRGDVMELTFDKPVMPDDMAMAIEGFSIADESGKFYMAHAAFPLKKDSGIWNTANKSGETTKVLVWSPLVKEPVAVRYGWATSPMGNLKVNGKEGLPLASFRTDSWDWPESEDPEETILTRGSMKELNAEAIERNEFRRTKEAENAVEILERLKSLGKPE